MEGGEWSNPWNSRWLVATWMVPKWVPDSEALERAPYPACVSSSLSLSCGVNGVHFYFGFFFLFTKVGSGVGVRPLGTTESR